MKKKHRRRLRFRLRWKDHFSFSVRETRGMFLLLVILSLEITALYYFRFVHTPELPEGWERLIRVADSLDLAERGADSLKGRLGAGRFPPTPRTSPDTLFPFDPNSIAKQEWMALGLSSRQAETVMRYRSRSGGFRIRSDLSRITVIPREKLSKWMPYILLPDTVERYKQPYRRFAVNVNVADSVAFERLKAVGPALAGRICRFRERLGGFQSLEQLREVYGMHDSVWNLVQPQLQIAEDPRLNRIDINRCPEDSLRRHPYIGAALARQMVVYRLQHAFRSVDELRRLPLYSEEISRKLVPYLKVGD